MNKSILVIDTPSSCSECKFGYNGECSLLNNYVKLNQRDSNCPLIDVDILKIELALRELKRYLKENSDMTMNDSLFVSEYFDTIKSTIDKLKDNGGNE